VYGYESGGRFLEIPGLLAVAWMDGRSPTQGGLEGLHPTRCRRLTVHPSEVALLEAPCSPVSGTHLHSSAVPPLSLTIPHLPPLRMLYLYIAKSPVKWQLHFMTASHTESSGVRLQPLRCHKPIAAD